MTQQALNVLGTPLVPCSFDPLTGFYRDGCCYTDLEDHGTHVVCAVVSDEFLQFSKLCGNDLSTPRPEYRFPGLKDGDRWCLCALRWASIVLVLVLLAIWLLPKIFRFVVGVFRRVFGGKGAQAGMN